MRGPVLGCWFFVFVAAFSSHTSWAYIATNLEFGTGHTYTNTHKHTYAHTFTSRKDVTRRWGRANNISATAAATTVHTIDTQTHTHTIFSILYEYCHNVLTSFVWIAFFSFCSFISVVGGWYNHTIRQPPHKNTRNVILVIYYRTIGNSFPLWPPAAQVAVFFCLNTLISCVRRVQSAFDAE